MTRAEAACSDARLPALFLEKVKTMKDKDKAAKESEKEKLKKRSHSKKLKPVSKRSPKIEDDEPGSKAEEPEDDDAEPVEIEPDEDDIEPDDIIEEEEEELVEEVPVPKSKSRRSAKISADGSKNGDESAKPQSRLGLIRTRHESMKREIEQIREDLDSDEEE